MSNSMITPYSATLESNSLFSAQCPDFLGQIWEIRKNDDLTTATATLINSIFESIKSYLTVELDLSGKQLDLSKASEILLEHAFSSKDTDSKVFGLKYVAAKAYEKGKQLESLYSQFKDSKTFEEAASVLDKLKKADFVSGDLKNKMEKPNIVPISISQFSQVSNDYKDEYARDVSAYWAMKQHEYRQKLEGFSHDPKDIYLSPLYLGDITSLWKRENDELRQHANEEKEKLFKQFPSLLLDSCLNINFDVRPMEGLVNPSSGAYPFVRSCLSLGGTKFLEKANELLALTKLKMVETGISTSLMVYNEDGTPFAIFKPDSFAGGSLENPKGTQVPMGNDIIEQASLKEVAASKVMNSISGAPETHLVEINLGGRIYQGSLQEFAPHNRSVQDIQTNLLYICSEALDIDMPKGVFEKLLRQEAVPIEEQMNFAIANQKYMLKILGSSYGMYLNQKILKGYYEDIQRILPEEIQQVGLHQLMTGNTDMNPANFLLSEKSDGAQQLIPVDFNLAFQKERAPTMAMLSLAFWFTHPYASETMSPSLVDYFKNYDVEGMANQLRNLGLDEERVINFQLRALLIQKAVSKSLTLSETACLFVPRVITKAPAELGTLPEMKKTLSEELITSFYKSYDQAVTKEDKDEALLRYQEQINSEINALLKRLEDPKSFESRMRDLQADMLNPKSLKEFEQNALELRALTGLGLVMPNFELATDEQIEEVDSDYSSAEIERMLKA